MLTLYRTPLVLGSNPGARVCFVEVKAPYTETVEFPDKSPITLTTRPRQTWPAIENADDPDKMPVGEYALIMTRMASSQRPALWVEGTELFLHGLARGEDFDDAKISDARAGTPDMLKGCPMPGIQLSYRGGVIGPDRAMIQIFKALGGWTEGKRVPFRCVELGELPTTRYEVVEISDGGLVFDSALVMDTHLPGAGERWTRLPNGDVLVEREVTK